MGIKGYESGFVLKFSDSEFQGSQMMVSRQREQNGGNWYKLEQINLDGKGLVKSPVPHEGWLCPALFKYYDKAPQKIYVRVESK